MEVEETHDYIYFRDISSSDIISSSEREYEDIGINNIYSYKSPKYKTLIEVVLKPSEQTYDMKVTHAYYKDDSNKLTDEEWNQLKHEFIPDYLEDLSSGVDQKSTNENTIDNIYI